MELLVGVVVNRFNLETALSVEAAHRLSDHWKIEAEARLSVKVPDGGYYAGFRNDDFVQISLQRYF